MYEVVIMFYFALQGKQFWEGSERPEKTITFRTRCRSFTKIYQFFYSSVSLKCARNYSTISYLFPIVISFAEEKSFNFLWIKVTVAIFQLSTNSISEKTVKNGEVMMCRSSSFSMPDRSSSYLPESQPSDHNNHVGLR